MQLLRTVLIIGVVAVPLSSHAAQPTDAGSPNDKLPASVSEILRNAEAGSARAQVQMADLYASGSLDIPADPATAAGWLKKAADQSYSTAEYKLSIMYAQGIGVSQSDAEATRLLSLSAQHGLPIAEYVTARFLEDGKKLPQDYDLARTYYIRAAESGYQQAQVSLARGYLVGRGPLPVDKEQALFWAHIAGEGHDAVAANMRAIAAGCAQTMSREAIDRASKRVADWDKEHATLR